MTRRGSSASSSAILRYADLRMDLLRHQAWRGQRQLFLSPREFDLLRFLIRHPEQVLSRVRIYENVWDRHYELMGNVIEVYINYLRRKLEAAGEPRLIQTIRGSGYILQAETPGQPNA